MPARKQTFQYTVKDLLGNEDSSQVFTTGPREEYALSWNVAWSTIDNPGSVADEGDPTLPPSQRHPLGALLYAGIDRPAPAGGITIYYNLLSKDQVHLYDPSRPDNEIADSNDVDNSSGTIFIPEGSQTPEEPIKITPIDDDLVETNEWAYYMIKHDPADFAIVTQTPQYVVHDASYKVYDSFKILDNEWRWVAYADNPPSPTTPAPINLSKWYSLTNWGLVYSQTWQAPINGNVVSFSSMATGDWLHFGGVTSDDRHVMVAAACNTGPEKGDILLLPE
jgi:hypothetical protein